MNVQFLMFKNSMLDEVRIYDLLYLKTCIFTYLDEDLLNLEWPKLLKLTFPLEKSSHIQRKLRPRSRLNPKKVSVLSECAWYEDC